MDGRKIALFGSYGWGDGEWMRDWCKRCGSAGAVLLDENGLIVNEAPDADGEAACKCPLQPLHVGNQSPKHNKFADTK